MRLAFQSNASRPPNRRTGRTMRLPRIAVKLRLHILYADDRDGTFRWGPARGDGVPWN